MRIKIHKQPSFPQPHPFPKQPIQAPPFFKIFKSVFTLLCTRAAFAHNPQAGLCKAHAAYGLSIAAAAAAVVTAAAVVISATAADKDYKNDNP